MESALTLLAITTICSGAAYLFYKAKGKAQRTLILATTALFLYMNFTVSDKLNAASTPEPNNKQQTTLPQKPNTTPTTPQEQPQQPNTPVTSTSDERNKHKKTIHDFRKILYNQKINGNLNTAQKQPSSKPTNSTTTPPPNQNIGSTGNPPTPTYELPEDQKDDSNDHLIPNKDNVKPQSKTYLERWQPLDKHKGLASLATHMIEKLNKEINNTKLTQETRKKMSEISQALTKHIKEHQKLFLPKENHAKLESYMKKPLQFRTLIDANTQMKVFDAYANDSDIFEVRAMFYVYIKYYTENYDVEINTYSRSTKLYPSVLRNLQSVYDISPSASWMLCKNENNQLIVAALDYEMNTYALDKKIPPTTEKIDMLSDKCMAFKEKNKNLNVYTNGIILKNIKKPICSPNGTYLCYTKNKKLYLQDLNNIKNQPTCLGAGNNPLFSPDGKHLCYTNNKKLYLQDLDNIKNQPTCLGAGNNPLFSPDGKHLCYTNSKKLYLQDLNNLQREPTCLGAGKNPVFSPNNSSIAYILANEFKLYDYQKSAHTKIHYQGKVKKISFTKDSAPLLYGSNQLSLYHEGQVHARPMIRGKILTDASLPTIVYRSDVSHYITSLSDNSETKEKIGKFDKKQQIHNEVAVVVQNEQYHLYDLLATSITLLASFAKETKNGTIKHIHYFKDARIVVVERVNAQQQHNIALYKPFRTLKITKLKQKRKLGEVKNPLLYNSQSKLKFLQHKIIQHIYARPSMAEILKKHGLKTYIRSNNQWHDTHYPFTDEDIVFNAIKNNWLGQIDLQQKKKLANIITEYATLDALHTTTYTKEHIVNDKNTEDILNLMELIWEAQKILHISQ